MDLKKYYSKLNSKALKNYEKQASEISGLRSDLKQKSSKEAAFLLQTAEYLTKCFKLEKDLDENFFESKTTAQIKTILNPFYSELRPRNYQKSYMNPDYAADVFGSKTGKYIYALYYHFIQFKNFAFEHKIYQMEKYNRMFLEMYAHFSSGKKFSEKFLKELAVSYNSSNDPDEIFYSYKEMFGRDFTHYREIVLNSSPKDIKYLYRYNINITDNEIRTVEFFRHYSKQKLDALAKQIAKAYAQGFINSDKELSRKSSVLLRFSAGQEELIKRLIFFLNKNYGLESIVGPPSTTPVNKQINHDLKFINATYLNKEFADKRLEATENAMSRIKDDLDAYSGIILVESFGEKPFSPQSKKTAWSLSPEQQLVFQNLVSRNQQLRQKFIPRTETSFCIIAFPSPEIGKDFESIFEDIMEVNMLDSGKYEKIQKNIIDAIDKAERVHVKGRNGNLTDIIIMNQKLKNPAKHTNYCNCGADVNIPVGEVFTSPKLTGTNGTLHIKETFLNGLKFKELRLEFKDGFISDYSCSNFKKKEDNEKFIKENLIFPHKTLPIGEFAIGTNTLAYTVAKKYDILEVLPVLIIEKMGPHFAIGDTCYSHEEDKAVFNPIDNKQITARDNEMSINRKKDHAKAYTGVHTDITLPYEDIDFISGIASDGEKIDIIRSGRFIVKGTEDLNIPLDKAGI